MIARVTPAEHELLVVARALFDPRQHAVVAPLVRTERTLGDSIGRSSMHVLKDILAKGTVQRIARSGAHSRAWERSRPALRFSETSFAILQWLVSTPLASPVIAALKTDGQLTLADELLMVAVLDLARTAGVTSAVLAQKAFRASPLLALHAIDEFARAKVPVPDLARHAKGDGLELIAALGSELAARWKRIEREKARIVDPAVLTALGHAQAEILAPLVTPPKVEALVFLLDSASLLPLATLDPQTPLGARAEARRMAVAPLRAIGKISALRERLRLVGFVDDDYEDAQRVLRFLEPWNDLFPRAEAVVHAADALEDPS
ncbi:MAG: hypothetical protein ACXWP4_10495 [Polyangiales bacterium]